MNRPSLGEIADRLVREGRLSPSAAAQLSALPAGDESGSTPWFVRALVAVSAWLAALLLIGFFSMAQIVSSKESAFITGVLLLSAAIGLRRRAGGDFVRQLALAASLAGQVLVIGAIAHYGNALVAAAATAVLLQVVLIPSFPDKLHRVLSVVVAVAGLRILFAEWQWTAAQHGLVTALAAGLAALWWNEARLAGGRLADIYRPVGHGLALALFGLLLPSILSPALQGELRALSYPSPWLSAVGLGVVLLVLAGRLLAEAGQRPGSTVALAVYAGILLFMLPALQAPGILAVLVALLTGFRRGERVLIGMSLAFFALFLGAYYYHLPISLLAKSMVLGGSGLVLLMARQWLLPLLAAEGRHAQ